MALINCPECKHEVSDQAVTCPNCGFQLQQQQPSVKTQPEKKKSSSNGCLVAIVIIIIVGAIGYFSSQDSTKPTSSTKEKLELSITQKANINEWKSGDLIKINPQLNLVQVDPIFWRAMDADQKENFSAMMAIHCGNEKGTQLYWADIKDKQSGRKLAKYSKSWGFEIY